MMITDEQAAQLGADFPPTFGLRGFPGDTFRVGLDACFVGDSGQMVLYTRRWNGVAWVDFAKGSAAEIRREMVVLDV